MYVPGPGVLINVYSDADPDEAFQLNLNCFYCLSKYNVLGQVKPWEPEKILHV